MGMPAVTVRVAFTTDPGATPTWTDISGYLKTFTVHRGRSDDQSPFNAGQAQIVLSNETRAFDPTYASSPYYPNVLPMRRISIQATYNAITYDVFNGYVTNWQQTYDPPADAECVVTAADAFKVLANITLPDSAYAAEVRADTPANWWRLGEPAGSTTARDSVGTASVPYVGSPTLGVAGLVAHSPLTAAQFPTINDKATGTFGAGGFPLGTAATVEFLYRLDSNTAPNGWLFELITTPIVLSSATGIAIHPAGGNLEVDIGNNAATSINVFSTGVDFTVPGVTHHVAVVIAAGAAVKIYIDGVDRTSGSTTFSGSFADTTNPWLVGINGFNYGAFNQTGTIGTLDEVALYTTALSAARVAAHNTAARTPWNGDTSGARVGRLLDAGGWPAADRNIDSGVSVLQSADLNQTLLAALQKVEQTEDGALFATAAGLVRFIARDNLLKTPYNTPQATFGDTGTDLEYGDMTYEYDDTLIFNEVRVSRSGGVTQVVADPTSQTHYLRRSKEIDGLLHQSDSTSLDRAYWELTHYSSPILRITGMRLEPSANNDATHFPQALGRELLDRVTAKRTPQNLGATIQQDVLIQGISHTVTAMEWITDWNLSPAETQAYWIAGVAGSSEAGQTTRAGF